MKSHIARSIVFASVLFFAALGVKGLFAEEKKPAPRFFELRIYTAAPGKLDALHARFRDKGRMKSLPAPSEEDSSSDVSTLRGRR